MVRLSSHHHAVSIWSFAAVLWALICLLSPGVSADQKSLISQIRKRQAELGGGYGDQGSMQNNDRGNSHASENHNQESSQNEMSHGSESGSSSSSFSQREQSHDFQSSFSQSESSPNEMRDDSHSEQSNDSRGSSSQSQSNGQTIAMEYERKPLAYHPDTPDGPYDKPGVTQFNPQNIEFTTKDYYEAHPSYSSITARPLPTLTYKPYAYEPKEYTEDVYMGMPHRNPKSYEPQLVPYEHKYPVYTTTTITTTTATYTTTYTTTTTTVTTTTLTTTYTTTTYYTTTYTTTSTSTYATVSKAKTEAYREVKAIYETKAYSEPEHQQGPTQSMEFYSPKEIRPTTEANYEYNRPSYQPLQTSQLPSANYYPKNYYPKDYTTQVVEGMPGNTQGQYEAKPYAYEHTYPVYTTTTTTTTTTYTTTTYTTITTVTTTTVTTTYTTTTYYTTKYDTPPSTPKFTNPPMYTFI